MSKIGKIFLIITMILSFAMVVVGFVFYLYFSNIASNETLMNMLERMLKNYGIMDSTGYSPLFQTTGVVETVKNLGALILGVGFMSIPCAIACIRALRYPTKGRMIGVIVCGVIGLNVVGIFSGIFALIGYSRDGELY